MRIKKIIVKKSKIPVLEIFLRAYFFISIVIVVLFLILFFNTGYWGNYKNQFLNRLYTSSVINYKYLPEIVYKNIRAKFYKLPYINLNISFQNQLNLEKQRIDALKSFSYDKERTPFKEVNASINYNNQRYGTDLRIKGDRKSHWFEKDRTSYKLDLKKNKKILGMEKFSLQKPRVRNYIHEWIFFELIGELDLIKLNYMFVDLSINGSDPKLFALEEGFDKILVERNKKRNGPIFSLHEEFTREIKKAKFEVYNKKFWLNDENLKFTQIARKKLEIFFKNDQKTIEIFDIDKWAKFFAITDLNYYPHARAAKSVKFFYNPISSLFEPIGFDAHRSVPNFSKYIKKWGDFPIQNSFQDALNCKKSLDNCLKGGSRVGGNYLVYRFFFDDSGNLNKEFYKKYRKNLLNITSKKFLDNFFSERKNEIEKINSLIYGDYFFADHNYFYGPGLYYFSKNDIYLRAENLKNFFKTNINKIFVEQEGNNIIINNILNNNLELRLTLIECEDLLTSQKFIFSIDKKINKEFTYFDLTNLSKNLKLKCLNITFSNSKGNNFDKIVHQNLDYDIKKFTELGKNLFKQYFNIKNQNIFLKEKNTVIDTDIFIPENFIVHILPGQKIKLENNSFIFSNSAWKVDGSDEKIIISGTKKNFGGGILINDKKNSSLFKNVEISYLSGPKQIVSDSDNKLFTNKINYIEGKINTFNKEMVEIENNEIQYNLNYILYGSLNFSNTEVHLNKVSFKKICSEDALNIISSKFLIENVYFEENCSDSIDIDFGNGEISNANFDYIGNDAIDFSGSVAELNNIFLKNVGDKLISVGENSLVRIKNLTGNNSYVGIASKDGSLTNLEDVRMNNIKIGLAAYIKKDEYNAGKIIAKKILINNSKINWLTDQKSTIILDQEKLNSKTNSIIPIIYNKEENLIYSKN